MAWVEILPRFASLFRHRRWESASSFLSWTGILVNQHRHRQVEQVTLSSGETEECFFLKKEFAVTWRDRFRNAWHGFGWCSTAVREGAMLQALRAAGIGCPEVVALGEHERQAFVAMRGESSMTELRELLPTLNVEDCNRLAGMLGRELAKMHDAGFDHPDLFAKHILLARASSGFRVCIIDWQRGRHRSVTPWRLRCRDLAILDATLHKALANDRLRWRCLRAYFRALTAPARTPPHARLARQIRRQAERLRQDRNLREVGQLPVPARDQQFVPMQDGRLLVVRSHYENFRSDPLAFAGCGQLLANAAGSEKRLTAEDIPPLAHTLFRLQRFGVPAPRLLAVGRNAAGVFCCADSTATIPWAEAFAKASLSMRARMLWQAGRIVRQIHEAGYYLPAGDSWENRLGLVLSTRELTLISAEPLLRGHACWQELAPLELNRQKFRLSQTEQMRFLQGYLKQWQDGNQQRRAKKSLRTPGLLAWERQATS